MRNISKKSPGKGGKSLKIVSFDIKSSVAHFRRPDTTATQLTYPFIPPTVAKGLVGAILGIEDFTTTDKIGIQLLSEMRMVSQQLSLLGKGGGSTFNRPTTIQLLVEPAYRLYYAGEQYTDELEHLLQNKQSVYTTYLGSAYALTTPTYVDTWELPELTPNEQICAALSVVPVSLIKELIMEDGYFYQRASGFMKDYQGNRTFEKSVDFIFEPKGEKLKFKPTFNQPVYTMVEMDDDIICLV